MAVKLPRLVLVTWVDPCAGHTGWQSFKRMASAEPSTCYSVGFVVVETKEKIVLSPDYSRDHNGRDDGGTPFAIPKSTIRSIKRLPIQVTVATKGPKGARKGRR